jgi:protein SCO1/2
MKTPQLAMAVTAAIISVGAGAWALHGAERAPQPDAFAALDRSVLPVAPAAPLEVPPLAAADGRPFDAARLRGHWSLVFFGFTSCADVCPTTLQTLAQFAGDPASGVASGATQVVFVSIDPERDTPSRIRAYVEAFDKRFVGVTGDHAALARFGAAAGAGFAANGHALDHSTSVFVVDPQGRLAGVLLHPANGRSVRADLESLRG